MKPAQAFVVSVLSMFISLSVAYADHHGPSGDQTNVIKSVLGDLRKDNNDYVKHHPSKTFSKHIKGQHPRATVITCSDSRVHTPALDKTPEGDLFMIRNIGNQLETNEGSVEYGVRHLNTPLLLIIGHSSCGAVKAAMGDFSTIEAPIKRELATLHVLGKNAKDDQQVKSSVETNVNNQVMAAMKKFAEEIKAKSLTVVGAVYDFRNDYKQGNGKLVIVNVNGETNAAKIRASELLSK